MQFDNSLFCKYGSKNITIRNNEIKFTGTNTLGIALQGGGSGTTTSATVKGNRIRTAGQGIGLRVDPGAGGVFEVLVTANDFRGNQVGVFINSGSGGSVAGINLGGGPLGSAGKNDFRSFTAVATPSSGAIVVSASTAAGPVQARKNVFSVTNREKVIYDQSDDPLRANVVV